MSRVVICIARTVGAGGETIGRAVADRLGFRYVDEEVITLASEKAGVDAKLVEQAEHRTSILTRLLDAMATRPTFDTYLPTPEGLYYAPQAEILAPPVPDDLRALIREAIAEIADRRNAVIVAHAASYALVGRPDVLRVLVTAPQKTRIERLFESTKYPYEEDAARAVKESDKEREYYLRTFYHVREELPTDYDLVVNTAVLKVDQAVDAIVSATRSE